MLNNVVLPAPFGPINADDLALSDGKRHAGKRLQAAEPTRYAADVEHRHGFTARDSRARKASITVMKPRGRHKMTAIRMMPKTSCDSPAARDDNSAFMISSSGMMKNAPRMGPAAVPTPPMIAINAIRIEMLAMPNTVSGSKNTAIWA